MINVARNTSKMPFLGAHKQVLGERHGFHICLQLWRSVGHILPGLTISKELELQSILKTSENILAMIIIRVIIIIFMFVAIIVKKT